MKFFKNLDDIAQAAYLSITCTTPEQEPSYEGARWYHLLWFLIPIAGFVIFVAMVEANFVHEKPRTGRAAKR